MKPSPGLAASFHPVCMLSSCGAFGVKWLWGLVLFLCVCVFVFLCLFVVSGAVVRFGVFGCYVLWRLGV